MQVSAIFTGRRRVLLTAALAGAIAAVSMLAPAIAASAGPAAAGAAASGLTSGQGAALASVPWSRIGPGWVLAEYSATTGGEGVPRRDGATTLYLADPAGHRYALGTWGRHSAQAHWLLQAWSGDSLRALFVSGGNGFRLYVHQLDLRTGRFTSFTLPANTSVLGYTRPSGLNILAERGTPTSLTSKLTLVRYDLRGQLQRTLATVTDLGQVASQPNGLALAAGSLHGLELIANAGGVIRSLRVPGVQYGCGAVRWWNAGTILASCSTSSAGPRMWLVPASGRTPQAFTPVRHGGFDAGDFNAWQISSGLYVDGVSACGTLVIGRQPAHGPETFVNVPGSASSLIVTATRSQLLVQRTGGCQPGTSLAWFNPATRAITVAVPVRGREWGVIEAVPYFVTGTF